MAPLITKTVFSLQSLNEFRALSSFLFLPLFHLFNFLAWYGAKCLRFRWKPQGPFWPAGRLGYTSRTLQPQIGVPPGPGGTPNRGLEKELGKQAGIVSFLLITSDFKSSLWFTVFFFIKASWSIIIGEKGLKYQLKSLFQRNAASRVTYNTTIFTKRGIAQDGSQVRRYFSKKLLRIHSQNILLLRRTSK